MLKTRSYGELFKTQEKFCLVELATAKNTPVKTAVKQLIKTANNNNKLQGSKMQKTKGR